MNICDTNANIRVFNEFIDCLSCYTLSRIIYLNQSDCIRVSKTLRRFWIRGRIIPISLREHSLNWLRILLFSKWCDSWFVGCIQKSKIINTVLLPSNILLRFGNSINIVSIIIFYSSKVRKIYISYSCVISKCSWIYGQSSSKLL